MHVGRTMVISFNIFYSIVYKLNIEDVHSGQNGSNRLFPT